MVAVPLKEGQVPRSFVANADALLLSVSISRPTLNESESDYRHKKQKTQSYSEHCDSPLGGRTINSHRELPCSTKPASPNASARWRFPQQPFRYLSVLDISMSCGAQLDCCEEVHHDPHDWS